MNNRLGALSTTKKTASTAHQNFVFDMLNLGITNGTGRGGHNGFCILRAPICDNRNYLGDDIPRSPDYYSISYFDTQTLNFIHVMKGRITDGYPADKNRLQSRHRGYGTGTSYLKLYLFQYGGDFLRGKLIGHCPARSSCIHSQPFLKVEMINLDHHAINFIIKLITPGQQVQAIGITGLHAYTGFTLWINRQAPVIETIEYGAQCIRQVTSSHQTIAVAVHG